MSPEGVELAVEPEAGAGMPAAAKTRPATRRRLRLPQQTLLRHLLLGALALAVMYVVTDALPEFRNFQVMEVSFTLCAVAGLTMLIGVNGQISLGQGALMLIGAYTVALLRIHAPGIPTAGQLLIGVLVTAAFGALIGAGAARLRGPYLAGATLALAIGLPAIPTHYVDTLGGDTGLFSPTMLEPPSWLGGFVSQFHYLAWVGSFAAVVTLVLLGNLARSGIGRNFRAVRDDEVAAQLAGVHVARTQVTAFTVASACAGLAGGLMLIAVNSVSPGAFELTLSIGLLTAAILGGLGSLAGAVIGSVVLVALPSFTEQIAKLTSLDASREAGVELGIYGLALVLVMLVAPGGLVGLLRAAGARTRRRRR